MNFRLDRIVTPSVRRVVEQVFYPIRIIIVALALLLLIPVTYIVFIIASVYEGINEATDLIGRGLRDLYRIVLLNLERLYR